MPVWPASAVLGATIYLIGSASGVSQVYDQIEELFESLASFTPRLQGYMAVNMRSNLRQNVVSILQCILEIIARSEKIIKEGRFRKYLGVSFVGRDEGITELFAKLRRLCDEDERLVLPISYATSQRLDSKTETIGQSTQVLVETVTGMNAKLADLAIDAKGMLSTDTSAYTVEMASIFRSCMLSWPRIQIRTKR
jgi:fungal STAND N-terminal Goodbye domain